MLLLRKLVVRLIQYLVGLIQHWNRFPEEFSPLKVKQPPTKKDVFDRVCLLVYKLRLSEGCFTNCLICNNSWWDQNML